jgi:transcriptional regulator with XRE-family HTH domain
MAIWSGETIGQRIERLREGCGLTQFELGERVDLSEHVIYRIEKDRVRIENSRDMLERLAVVLVSTILNQRNVV